jgi:HEAT repeat protein
MWTKIVTLVLPFMAAMGVVFATTAAKELPDISYKGNTLEGWTSMLKSSSVDSRREAAISIAEMGPLAKDAVGDLVKALDDDDQIVRCVAAQALGNIGPDAKDAAKIIREKMLTSDKPFYQSCLAALRKIDGKSASSKTW